MVPKAFSPCWSDWCVFTVQSRLDWCRERPGPLHCRLLDGAGESRKTLWKYPISVIPRIQSHYLVDPLSRTNRYVHKTHRTHNPLSRLTSGGVTHSVLKQSEMSIHSSCGKSLRRVCRPASACQMINCSASICFISPAVRHSMILIHCQYKLLWNPTDWIANIWKTVSWATVVLFLSRPWLKSSWTASIWSDEEIPKINFTTTEAETNWLLKNRSPMLMLSPGHSLH